MTYIHHILHKIIYVWLHLTKWHCIICLVLTIATTYISTNAFAHIHGMRYAGQVTEQMVWAASSSLIHLECMCVYTWKTRIWLDTTWLCPRSSIPCVEDETWGCLWTVTPPLQLCLVQCVKLYVDETADRGRKNWRPLYVVVGDAGGLHGRHWTWGIDECPQKDHSQEKYHWRH